VPEEHDGDEEGDEGQEHAREVERAMGGGHGLPSTPRARPRFGLAGRVTRVMSVAS
jgi:hypothetical protein